MYRRSFGIVFRQPKLISDIFFTQFSFKLWICILLCCLLLAFVMYFISKVENLSFGLKEIVSWISCILSQQSSEEISPSKVNKLINILNVQSMNGICFFSSFPFPVQPLELWFSLPFPPESSQLWPTLNR